MASIGLEGLSKVFDGLVAVDDLSLEIADGEFYVLLGPTGAGKTTTLRCLSGLERDHEGRVSIGGTDVTEWSPANRDVAMVFQQYSLYPHFTVRENLEFSLKSRFRAVAPEERSRRVERAAATLRIDHLLDRKTDKLSGGEMQRVSIGRAIVREPRAFLMDEPLSNLDAKLREALRLELKRLQRDLGATLLYVTHDQVEAMSMADRVGVIKDGTLIQSDTPYAVYNRPRNVFVAGFVGTPGINLFDAVVADGRIRLAGSADAFDLEPDLAGRLTGVAGDVIVGVRSEDIFLSREREPGTCASSVYVVEHMGMENLISFHVEHHHFRAATDAGFDPAVNEAIHYRFAQDKLHFFDKRTEENLMGSA